MANGKKPRRASRMKTRLACQITIDGRRHSGIVLNVSQLGLFARTKAKPALGSVVQARINLPGRRQPLELQAKVASRRDVPPQLLQVADGGIGLALQYAPEPYYSFLATLTPGGS